ncbi:MAG: diaminopimelate decarboxylase [Gammaproteobacteria bacterium]|nr:diaminopimelate decarboxylase [Gammaproteobacteria bacterium]MCW8987962.1 diaminopimelate decarboxylase [Gammaproteobacteria bacterium]MCW9030444.1 diaminopimelate decarboxylase [Gammaproteobacteria bacterium]
MHDIDPHAWWQRSDLGYQSNKLYFAGQSVQNLAYQFGTPSFVYSSARVEANLQRIRKALNKAGLEGRSSIFYAMKANRFAPLLRFIQQTELCGIDACSPNEIKHALSCGFSPSDISFTATSLSKKDYAELIRYDGMSVNMDTLHAIRTWGELKPGSEIGIRINPAIGISRSCNDRLQYAGCNTTKFGIYQEQFEQALELAAQYNLTVRKIHFHTGCGYLTSELEQLDRVFQECIKFVDAAPDVQLINIGGGLGVPHLSSDEKLDLDQWSKVLHKHFAHRNLHVEVEPGDYICKDAGLLLLSKTYVEQKRDTLYVGVDAGFNIAPEPAYYGLPFQPVPLVKNNSPLTKMTVVGNINEALDVWYENALLPNLDNHDYLALINAGAYSSSMSSNHCMRGEFSEFLLA